MFTILKIRPLLQRVCNCKDNTLETKALRVNFLVIDPSKQFETGNPVTWTNTLVLRTKLTENEDNRTVELFVAPKGTVKYTIDGSEPREGIPYLGAIKIENNDILLRAFAEAEGLETKNDFRFPSKGKKGLQIDPVKPAHLVSRSGRKLDSRAKTFEGLEQAGKTSATFESISLTIGQGNQSIGISIGEIAVDSTFIQALLTKVLEKFSQETPVTMMFRKVHFASGHDLKDFAAKLNLELNIGDVEQ